MYLNTALETCEIRDRKGLYKKARLGVLPNFTGISDPYEAPSTVKSQGGGGSSQPTSALISGGASASDEADLVLDTSEMTVHDAAFKILEHLQNAGYLPSKTDTPIESSEAPAKLN